MVEYNFYIINVISSSLIPLRGKILEMIRSPLEQFSAVKYIELRGIGYDWSINKTTIYLLLSIIILLYITKSNNNLKRTNQDILKESIYKYISKEIMEMLGSKEGKKYVPMIWSLLMIIGINNELGLIPYSYTITSQFIVTMTLSLTIWIGVTIIGIRKEKLNFIKLFIPSGLPIFMIPLIMIIEIISYISRIISLSVRLAANMISGHTILKIVSSFGIKSNSILLISLDILLLTLIIFLELGVGLIQALVFTLLTISYLKDVLHMDH